VQLNFNYRNSSESNNPFKQSATKMCVLNRNKWALKSLWFRFPFWFWFWFQ